jgi:hypothetical protein
MSLFVGLVGSFVSEAVVEVKVFGSDLHVVYFPYALEGVQVVDRVYLFKDVVACLSVVDWVKEISVFYHVDDIGCISSDTLTRTYDVGLRVVYFAMFWAEVTLTAQWIKHWLKWALSQILLGWLAADLSLDCLASRHSYHKNDESYDFIML